MDVVIIINCEDIVQMQAISEIYKPFIQVCFFIVVLASWKLLRHYGIPEKIITLIRNTYDGMTCKVTHAGRLTESFKVKTGVRQA